MNKVTNSRRRVERDCRTQRGVMSKNSRKGEMDRRASRTRRALADALIELGPKIGLDDLEVRTLALEAGIGRSTFYAHYADKDDFFVTSYGGMIAMCDGAARAKPGYRGVLPSLEVFTHMEEARAFALSLVLSEGYARSQGAREAKLYPIAEANLGRLYPRMTGARRRELAVFVAGAFSALTRWWMETGMRQSAQHMHTLFETLVQRVLADEGA
jgi:AcrR family transcriptional regulator